MRKGIQKIFIVIGVLILVVVVGLVYKEKNTNKQNTNQKTIVKKNVKIITKNNKGKQPIKVSEDKLEFEADPKYKKGDVIVSGITDEADSGYIRKVINTKKKGGRYLVQTEPAYLTDVFEKAHIVNKIELTENGIREVKKDTNENDAYMFSYPFEKRDDLISITGEVETSIWVEVQIDIDNGKIVGGITATDKSHVKGTWVYSGNVDDKSVREEIFRHGFSSYQFLVKDVPIVLTNEIVMSMEGNSALEGRIGLSYDATSEKTVGFQYNGKKNKVEEINNRDECSDGLHWETTEVSGNATGGVAIQLISKLYGVSGMDVTDGILGKTEGEAKASAKENLGGYAGCLDLSISSDIKGTLVADEPVFANGLKKQLLFKKALKPFWSDHWESSADWKNDLKWTETGKQNNGLKEILKQGNTYVTRYSEQNAISCPVFQFDYPSGWDIQSEEMSDGIDNPIEEKVVLVNDRGVTVTYWDCSRTLGGYSRSVVKAEILKVDDSEFVPGFPAGTNTDYSSLGSFMVAKVHLVGEMDPKLDSDYNATDSEFFAVVPAFYEGEREFQGQAGFVDEFSFEYPTPYAFIAEAPDGQFTPEEEKEVIEILKSFKIAE